MRFARPKIFRNEVFSMNVLVDLKELQRATPTAIITEEGDYFRLVSLNATRYGMSDYIANLLPRNLPIDRNGNPITIGEFHDEDFDSLQSALGGSTMVIRTGEFTPGTTENPAPTMQLKHPAESRDIAIHVLWNERHGYPLYDKGGLTGVFGQRYHASWYHRYPPATCHKSCCGEDVWVLPADGPIKQLCEWLAYKTNYMIAEGDAAARDREEAEREYQAHKAEFRQQFEESGLIERFREVYRSDDGLIVMALEEDEVAITCPSGVDRYPYDGQLIPTITASIERAQRANEIIDACLPFDTALLRLIFEGLI